MRTEPQDDIFKLLEENVEISKKILANTEKTRKALFWISVNRWVHTALWVIPIVLAAIYLPRLIDTLEGRINQMFNLKGGSLPIQNLLEQFQNNPDIEKYVKQFREQSAPTKK